MSGHARALAHPNEEYRLSDIGYRLWRDRSAVLSSFSLDRMGETGLGDAVIAVDDEELHGLRAVLARCSQRAPEVAWQTVRRVDDESSTRRVFLPLRDEPDLTQAIDALHAVLLTGEGTLDACCWLYGSATGTRIYRLDMRHTAQHWELWLLPEDGTRVRSRRVEGLWQTYLTCWTQALPIIRRDLHEGLRSLWHAQQWPVLPAPLEAVEG